MRGLLRENEEQWNRGLRSHKTGGAARRLLGLWNCQATGRTAGAAGVAGSHVFFAASASNFSAIANNVAISCGAAVTSATRRQRAAASSHSAPRSAERISVETCGGSRVLRSARPSRPDRGRPALKWGSPSHLVGATTPGVWRISRGTISIHSEYERNLQATKQPAERSHTFQPT
jgi:hypothetical protein